MIAVGVDTKKHWHVAVALCALGRLLGEITVPATAAGYRELVSWLAGLGGEAVVGIEGTGSYGAGLCQCLESAGVSVVEVERPHRRDRRAGKSDSLDALLAARRVLAGDGVSTPRASGSRSALGVLLASPTGPAFRSARGCSIELQGLLVTAPPALRERIGQGSGARLAERLVQVRGRRDAGLQQQTTLAVLRDLARRARQLDTQAGSYREQITRLVEELGPGLFMSRA